MCKSVVVIGLSLALLVGCTSSLHRWNRAKSIDNIEGYEHFLKAHQVNSYAHQARIRLGELYFENAIRDGTVPIIKTYLDFVIKNPAYADSLQPLLVSIQDPKMIEDIFQLYQGKAQVLDCAFLSAYPDNATIRRHMGYEYEMRYEPPYGIFCTSWKRTWTVHGCDWEGVGGIPEWGYLQREVLLTFYITGDVDLSQLECSCGECPEDIYKPSSYGFLTFPGIDLRVRTVSFRMSRDNLFVCCAPISKPIHMRLRYRGCGKWLALCDSCTDPTIREED
ncbi:MAG: hypothetical protein V1784_03085 [bacterium]